MNRQALNTEGALWLGDQKIVGNSAIAAPLAMVLSVALLMVAVKLQVKEIASAAWLVAAVSLACHVWFALIRSKLAISVYQYLFVRWGNARLEELVPVRRRARSLAVGAIGSWAVVVMQGLTLISLGLAYKYPQVIPVYAVVLAISCAYSTAFIYGYKALVIEVDRLSDVAPACEIRL